MSRSEEERLKEEGEQTTKDDRSPAPAGVSVEGEAEEALALLSELEEHKRKRVVLLQELVATVGQACYGKRQQAVAEALGITVRSVRRLVGQMREQGIASVVRRSRSDRGQSRIDGRWQQFIVQTYREGNRGSRQMSPAQVAARGNVNDPDRMPMIR
jgi:putative transposase